MESMIIVATGQVSLVQNITEIPAAAAPIWIMLAKFTILPRPLATFGGRLAAGMRWERYAGNKTRQEGHRREKGK